MNRGEKFHKNFNNSLSRIENFRNDPNMSVITEFLLTTEINPYSILPHNWAGALESAQSFDSLLGYIHHALYDDGEICFPVVNGAPRIVFANRHDDNVRNVILTDQEKEFESSTRFPTDYDITFLDSIEEFVKAATENHISELRKYFFIEAADLGIEFAKSHYSKYGDFDSSWVDEFVSLSYIKSAKQFKLIFLKTAMRRGVEYANNLFYHSEWYDEAVVEEAKNF